MRGKSVLLLLVAISCGTVAAIGASQVLSEGWNQGQIKTVPVYVAIADIDINEKLDATHVRVEKWPEDKVPRGAIGRLEDLKGKYARVRLYEGEPITARKLSDTVSNKSFVIPVGYRVASVKVKMDTAVSFLIQPGDRVDLIATFQRSRDIPQTVTIPILRNVRVFAVNSETESKVEDGKPIVAKTVTLLLKEDEDEILALASEMASIRLSLRNPKEQEEKSGEALAQRVTLAEVLSGRRSSGASGSLFSRSSGLLGFLKGRTSAQSATASRPKPSVRPAKPKEKWRLVVLTADGPSTYVWDDLGAPPRLVESPASEDEDEDDMTEPESEDSTESEDEAAPEDAPTPTP